MKAVRTDFVLADFVYELINEIDHYTASLPAISDCWRSVMSDHRVLLETDVKRTLQRLLS